MILLTRICTSERGTFGVLSVGGEPVCVTCEDPWKNNAKGESCIPKGKYRCLKYSSEKFPDVWEVTNVPGRSAILIHHGNTIRDTHGCILPGDSFNHLNGLPSITRSRVTMELLRTRFPGEFDLLIREAWNA